MVRISRDTINLKKSHICSREVKYHTWQEDKYSNLADVLTQSSLAAEQELTRYVAVKNLSVRMLTLGTRSINRGGIVVWPLHSNVSLCLSCIDTVLSFLFQQVNSM